MKLIRSLVFPWFLFFVLAVSAMIYIGVKQPHLLAHPKAEETQYALLGLGALLSLLANFRSLGLVGIWMADSIPDSLRYYGSWRWIFRALKAGIVAAAFWFVGQLPLMPLIWQAAVMPTILTITLFVAIWNLLGPILKWSSNLAWNRAFSMFLSLPVLAGVPITALFIGQTVLMAYRASQPELAMAVPTIAAQDKMPERVTVTGQVLSMTDEIVRLNAEWPIGSGQTKIMEVELNALSSKALSSLPKGQNNKEVTLVLSPTVLKEAELQSAVVDENDLKKRIKSTKPEIRATAYRDLYENSELCEAFTKSIQTALDPKGHKDVVYWAVRAVECSSVRAVIALPRLAQIMVEHDDAAVKAAAIKALKKYGNENTRQISYLIVKRISDGEPPEVIEAAAAALAPLGADHQKWSTNRLKNLLDDSQASTVAAGSLIKDFGRDDLVGEYVATHLAAEGSARDRAIRMVCLLPKAKRSVAEPHVESIVAAITTADQTDPALRAVDCLGKIGFQAIRDEVTKPNRLSREIAARALAELDANTPEVVEVASTCVQDNNDQVRSWCSQSLGQLGAAALPTILDLLESDDSKLKSAGRHALRYFTDPTAKDELRKIMDDNTGWMANNRKLKIAESVGTALIRIQGEQRLPSSPSGPTSTSPSVEVQ